MSTTTQHTPGPWYLTDIAIIGNNGGTWIAEHPAIKWRTLKSVTNSGDAIVAESIKQANANARLIAAAPELLEALETCVSELNQLAFLAGDKLANAAIEKGIEAIRKAKGGAQ